MSTLTGLYNYTARYTSMLARVYKSVYTSWYTTREMSLECRRGSEWYSRRKQQRYRRIQHDAGESRGIYRGTVISKGHKKVQNRYRRV